jgi:hypothetical protein
VCRLKISASAVELGLEDDFLDGTESIFINGLSVRSSLFAQKMSASAVELGSQGLCFRQRFLRHQ